MSHACTQTWELPAHPFPWSQSLCGAQHPCQGRSYGLFMPVTVEQLQHTRPGAQWPWLASHSCFLLGSEPL